MRIAIILLCLSAFFPVFSFALSAEDLTYITEEYPPHNYIENNEITGFSVDVLRLMWREMGIAPQSIEVQPWARGLHTLEQEPNVMLFAAGWTPERAKKFHFIKPLLSNESSAVALKSRSIIITSIADMQRYKVGTIRSDINEKTLLDAGLPVKGLERVANVNISAKMLAHERTDLMVGVTNAMFHALAEEGFDVDDFEIVYIVEYFENGYMLSQEIPGELVRQFQDALDTVRKTPEFRALIKKYFPLQQQGPTVRKP